MRKRQKGAVLKKGGPALPVVRSLVGSLIEEGEVVTNWSFAKAVQPEVDRLVSLVKRDSVAGRQKIMKFLGNKRNLVKQLTEVVAPALGGRVSGFTRVVRVEERRGDGVVLGKLSWVAEVKKMEEKEKSDRKIEKEEKKEDKLKVKKEK